MIPVRNRRTDMCSHTPCVLCRVLSFVLVIGMLCVVFSACNTSDTTPKETEMSLVNLSEVDEQTGIPVSWNYGGDTFTFGLTNPEEGISCNDIWVEDDPGQYGEPVYDAIRQRNINMSDKYEVNIAVVTAQSGVTDYRFVVNSVNAGDALFDAVIVPGITGFRLSLEGYLQDLALNSYLDLSQEIWDQNFVQSMTLNGHLYALVGSFTRMDYQATHAIAFNKHMLKQYEDLPSADDLYEMVRNGTWTLDVMLSLANQVRGDANGDGTYTSADRYGLLANNNSMLAFLQGCGIQIGQRDDNSETGVRYNGFSEKINTVWLTIVNAEAGYDIRNIDMDFRYEAYPSTMEEMLMEDRLLFAECTIGQIEQLRRYDIDFGILPIPKYDETQENYICAAHEDSTLFLSVPITNLDFENTGNILTAFSWEGYHVLRPAFYDITLKGKVVQDLESREMLDIIFSSKSYDLGVFANWAYCQYWIRRAWTEMVFRMAVVYARFDSRAQRTIEEQMSMAPYAKWTP